MDSSTSSSVPNLVALSDSSDDSRNSGTTEPTTASTSSDTFSNSNPHDNSAAMTSPDNFTPPAVFTVFPNLPIELREIIWKRALPTCNVITIRERHRDKPREGTCKGSPYSWTYRATARYHIPTLLHVNGEARSIAEAAYCRAFSNSLGSNPVYFNYDSGILYFEGVKAMVAFGNFKRPSKIKCGVVNRKNPLETEAIQRIRHIAIRAQSENWITVWVVNRFERLDSLLLEHQTPSMERHQLPYQFHQGKGKKIKCGKHYYDNSSFEKVMRRLKDSRYAIMAGREAFHPNSAL